MVFPGTLPWWSQCAWFYFNWVINTIIFNDISYTTWQRGKKTAFVSINNAHFKKKIIPGNRLDIEAELSSYTRGIAKGISKGYVSGELACTAELVIAIPDILNEFKPNKDKVWW